MFLHSHCPSTFVLRLPLGAICLRHDSKSMVRLQNFSCSKDQGAIRTNTSLFEPRPSALNMTLPACAAEHWRLLHGARSAAV